MNPFKGVKEQAEMLKSFGQVGKTQAEQVRQQVEQIMIQTQLMERWAVAAEKQSTELGKIREILEKWQE